MEDKDFEEWVKEETLKRISEFKKENPKLFPNGETNNKWDKYIEWSVRTKERGFRAGVEFGIKNSKEYLLIRCKKLCTSLDNLQNEAKEWRDERKEWQKKVEELKKGIPELRTKIMKKCYEPRDLVTVDKEQNERRKCYNAGIKFSSHDFEEFMNRLIDRIMGKKRGY